MGCGGFTCAKNALIALNVLYLLVAGILIGVAAWSRVTAVITSISIIGGIITCGVFLFLIALVGLVGAIKHHQVSLFFYMIILFIIFVIQFAVACALLAINKHQQMKIAEQSWNKASNKSKLEAMHAMNCCGFREQDLGPEFEEGHPPCVDVVKSCKHSEAVCCTGVSVETNGTSPTVEPCPARACMSIIEENIDQGIKATGGVGLFFSFTEIFGVWLTVKYRNLKDPRANPSAFL